MNQETDNEKIYKAVEAQRGFLSLCALYIIFRGLYTFSEGKPSMTWLSVASYIALAIMLLFISVFKSSLSRFCWVGSLILQGSSLSFEAFP